MHKTSFNLKSQIQVLMPTDSLSWSSLKQLNFIGAILGISLKTGSCYLLGGFGGVAKDA